MSGRSIRLRRSALLVLLVHLLVPEPARPQSTNPTITFRASRDVISIDVVVRDRSGEVVRGLTIDDFELREEGRTQELLTLGFDEAAEAAQDTISLPMLRQLGLPTGRSASAPREDVAGRRLLLLLFDLSGMEPDDVQRGVRAAAQFVDEQMTGADLVAVATLTWELRVLTDFTSDRQTVRDVLDTLVSVDASAVDPGGDPAANDVPTTSIDSVTTVAATDARLRALRLLADTLTPITQKKALLYFTAGLANAAQDSPAELRLAITAAARANLSVYPVDTRGLVAVIPSGPARVASRGGEGLFSGSDVNDQFVDLAASQDTMATMASATGGRMFTGSNDLGAAFTRVQRDTAAYYLLGYSTTNTARDGRFRRVQVRVKREGLRVEARTGYYADRDFAHTSRADRESELEERLLDREAPSSLALQTTTSWRRESSSSFVVPITLSMPWTPDETRKEGLDVLGLVEDEQGRAVARIRETLDVPDEARSAGRMAFTTLVNLPAGRFTVRAVVRENTGGETGYSQAEIRLPEQSSNLEPSPLQARSVSNGRWLDTVLTGARADLPLVVGLTLFRDGERVFDARLVRDEQGAGRGNVHVVRLPDSVPSGTYTYQITATEAATGRFAILRADMDIP